MPARLASAALFLLVVSCGEKDNSAVTDEASRDLAKAQSKLSEKRRDVVTTEDDVERRKRELVAEQQALADREKALVETRQQLGSAQTTLAVARTAYGAAVTSRLAKLDAALANLGTKTDAASKDAAAGLRARREALAAKLAGMTSTKDADWKSYAKDVDTTFDAIERDLKPD